MKRTSLTSLLCLSSLALVAQAPALSTPAQDARIEALLKQMTLEEKIGQLNQYSAGLPTGPGTNRNTYEAMIAAGKIGSLINVTDAKQSNEYQKIAVEKSRLRIPILYGLDVIHGFRTTFPVNIGLSATWDPALIEKTSRLAALEASAQGIRWTFSPMVDIARDARWGRISESAGEDPYLGAAMAKAYIHGYQGERLDEPTSILACAKHFVGYGAAEGGRDYNTTEISERSLRQVYLPPFQASAQAGVATFMAAFNSLNGVPASSNAFTLNQVLRKEWGFQGLVVSDWGSIGETMAHGIANEGAVAARKSFLAGVDMDMENDLYIPELPGLVKSGAVSMERVDDAVRRVLRMKFALGLFEKPFTQGDASERPLPKESLLLARTAAEESFVLLKNEGSTPLLPLIAKAGRKIALIGPLADGAQDMLGSWSAQGRPAEVITLRSALAERAVQEKMTLLYAKGTEILDQDESGFPEALRVAQQADVVILALGEKGELTGEAASRAHLDLSGKQQKLLEALAATGKPIVLVLFNGRPLTITWAAQHIPAILNAWFPGVQAGPALVRTLFGEVNPSGHLTTTFPRSVGQEPLYYNALNTGRPVPPNVDLSKLPGSGGPSRYTSRYIDELNAPLYPFGHGLSYTTFTYSPVSSNTNSLRAAALNNQSEVLTVSAEVTNSGRRSGTEVVQCYIRLTGTSVARPMRELKGFQRVELSPSQTKRVEFKLGKEELSFWNIDMKQVVEPCALAVWITTDSASGAPAKVTISE